MQTAPATTKPPPNLASYIPPAGGAPTAAPGVSGFAELIDKRLSQRNSAIRAYDNRTTGPINFLKKLFGVQLYVSGKRTWRIGSLENWDEDAFTGYLNAMKSQIASFTWLDPGERQDFLKDLDLKLHKAGVIRNFAGKWYMPARRKAQAFDSFYGWKMFKALRGDKAEIVAEVGGVRFAVRTSFAFQDTDPYIRTLAKKHMEQKILNLGQNFQYMELTALKTLLQREISFRTDPKAAMSGSGVTIHPVHGEFTFSKKSTRELQEALEAITEYERPYFAEVPVYQTKKKAKTNPRKKIGEDEDGNPIYKPVLDDQGNVVLEEIRDETTGLPILERDLYGNPIPQRNPDGTLQTKKIRYATQQEALADDAASWSTPEQYINGIEKLIRESLIEARDVPVLLANLEQMKAKRAGEVNDFGEENRPWRKPRTYAKLATVGVLGYYGASVAASVIPYAIQNVLNATAIPVLNAITNFVSFGFWDVNPIVNLGGGVGHLIGSAGSTIGGTAKAVFLAYWPLWLIGAGVAGALIVRNVARKKMGEYQSRAELFKRVTNRGWNRGANPDDRIFDPAGNVNRTLDQPTPPLGIVGRWLIGLAHRAQGDALVHRDEHGRVLRDRAGHLMVTGALVARDQSNAPILDAEGNVTFTRNPSLMARAVSRVFRHWQDPLRFWAGIQQPPDAPDEEPAQSQEGPDLPPPGPGPGGPPDGGPGGGPLPADLPTNPYGFPVPAPVGPPLPLTSPQEWRWQDGAWQPPTGHLAAPGFISHTHENSDGLGSQGNVDTLTPWASQEQQYLDELDARSEQSSASTEAKPAPELAAGPADQEKILAALESEFPDIAAEVERRVAAELARLEETLAPYKVKTTRRVQADTQLSTVDALSPDITKVTIVPENVSKTKRSNGDAKVVDIETRRKLRRKRTESPTLRAA